MLKKIQKNLIEKKFNKQAFNNKQSNLRRMLNNIFPIIINNNNKCNNKWAFQELSLKTYKPAHLYFDMCEEKYGIDEYWAICIWRSLEEFCMLL